MKLRAFFPLLIGIVVVSMTSAVGLLSKDDLEVSTSPELEVVTSLEAELWQVASLLEPNPQTATPLSWECHFLYAACSAAAWGAFETCEIATNDHDGCVGALLAGLAYCLSCELACLSIGRWSCRIP